jgi:hypothetical protein
MHFSQQTIFGKFYSVISFIIYLLLFNNPQITKALSENVSLNNSNNFLNSFKKYLEMNTNKLHIITHTHTNTHNLSLSSLNTKLFYSVLETETQCSKPKNKLHPYYITGFVDGSFYIKISSPGGASPSRGKPVRASKNLVSFRFLVTQHVRDVELLKNLIIYLKCGYYLPRSNSVSHGDYFVTDLEDIKCKILPFFEKFPLQGNKLKDFLDFKKACPGATPSRGKHARAVELKGGGNRTPLTTKNLADIKQIKQGMNKKRISDDNEKTLLDSNPSTRRPSIKSKGSAPSYLSPKIREGINKRHYSSTAIISKEQPKSDQIKFFE